MRDFREKIVHHGGFDGVTGSCHEWFYADNASIMVDCGLFQGDEAHEQDLNFHFDVSRIRAVVLTHGHIDHVGRLPWLIAAGFRGPIICTQPTAKLLPIILEDALQLQLPDQDVLVKRALERIIKQILGVAYNKPIQSGYSVSNDFQPPQIVLQNAGHILGSAYVEIAYRGKTTVFSGDLGPSDALMNPKPVSPLRADRLILESTYGDRQHQGRADRLAAFKQIILRSLEDGGPILIPAFSLGRTQELLASIEAIKIEAGLTQDYKEPWEGQRLPVILDSPLASRLTFAYRQLRPWWKDQIQHQNPFSFDSLATVQSHGEHLSIINHLKSTGRAAIVLSASGMCQGGRILNYLEAFLPRDNTDVVFAGYQAKGTLGRQLVDDVASSDRGYADTKRVDIRGNMVDVNAKIYRLTGFSAHADQSELLEFVKGIPVAPSEIRLVHGSADARKQLGLKLADMNTVVRQ